MNLNRALSLVAVSALVPASLASAHGVQVQVTYDASLNKIVTREISRSSAPNVSTITSPERIYVMPILPTQIGGAAPGTYFYTRPAMFDFNASGNPSFPSGPGIGWQYDVVDGATATPVTQIAGTGWSLRNSTTNVNLGGSNFRYRLMDTLKVWNGASFVDPGTESLQLLNSDGANPAVQTVQLTSAGTTGTGSAWTHTAVNGNPATLPNAASRPHISATFRLANNGNQFSASDPGVYLLALSIETTALSPSGAAINPSDTFYYVMPYGVSLNDGISVAQSLSAANGIPLSQIQVVPEPATLSLIAGAGPMGLRRRSRSRRHAR